MNVDIGQELKSSTLMLAFYPRDFGFFCTKQLCNYQESYAKFEAHGLKLYGISPNNPEEHYQFKKRFKFSFELLSDPNKEIFKTYGVSSLFTLGGMSRAVFIVGKNGVILYRYVEPTQLTLRNVATILKTVETLKQSGRI